MANQRQRNATRRDLEPFLLCSALASTDAGMHQYAFQVEELSVPVQWSQVVDHIGHPDRAAARMCGHLGNLASALSAHGGAGGKSIIIFFQLRK